MKCGSSRTGIRDKLIAKSQEESRCSREHLWVELLATQPEEVATCKAEGATNTGGEHMQNLARRGGHSGHGAHN